ncbi:MAG: sensor histidine kinase [Bdellovibrionales bacterium]
MKSWLGQWLVNKKEGTNDTKRLSIGFGLVSLLFTIAVVSLNFQSQLNTKSENYKKRFEYEINSVEDSFHSFINNSSISTSFFFNSGGAALKGIEQFVASSRDRFHIVMFDKSGVYFGKNVLNPVDRFKYKALVNHSFVWEQDPFHKKFYYKDFEINQGGDHLGTLRAMIDLQKLVKLVGAESVLSDVVLGTVSKVGYSCDFVSPKITIPICVKASIKSAFNNNVFLIVALLLFWLILYGLIFIFVSGKIERARLTARLELSSQVSHDIQSPLLALKMSTKDISSHIPEEQRLMLASSISRIEDIVNDLRNKKIADENQYQAHLIADLVKNIVSEKRIQYQNLPGIYIEPVFLGDSYGAFTFVNSVDFKRILSNLINNSVEALGSSGDIGVEVSSNDEIVNISIVDNGPGIPDEIMDRILEKGFSHGKQNGQGLGLYHAYKHILRLGGDLQVHSRPGLTRIDIQLQRIESPNWFVDKLEISSEQKIIIVDDNENIHRIWRQRFSLQATPVEILNFFDYETLIEEFESINTKDAVFLLDYEILGSELNGVEAAERLGITHSSFLVSSRFDEVEILERISKIGMRSIPKPMVGELRIEINHKKIDKLKLNENEIVDLKSSKDSVFVNLNESEIAICKSGPIVLLDDDPLVHLTWKMRANESKIDLRVYQKPEELLADLSKLGTEETSFFLDSNLGNDLKGELWSENLKDQGYENIFITTGLEAKEVIKKDWIKKVIGKEPPF